MRADSGLSRWLPLVALLLLQQALLFRNLDLLPVWTDEQFTVDTVAQPVAQIAGIVKRDIHPPLYYFLLHGWQKLSLPWEGVAELRAFSAIWALLATFLLDLWWTRSWPPFARWSALALFAMSPCLLLYGRMARSYSMQMALALMVLALMRRWIDAPASRKWAAGVLASSLCLLYTHYAPGIALVAGFVAISWRTLGWKRLSLFLIAVGVGYLPWLMAFAGAIERWGGAPSFSANYAISGNRFAEHLVKLAFGTVSLTIGETFAAASFLLIPLVVWLVVLGVRSPDWPLPPAAWICLVAALGYVGVSRWVSYPFIPARLLWLLPLQCLAVAQGLRHWRRPSRALALFVIFASYGSSAMLYFRRENFLNLGYNAPLPEIAATLNREARSGDLILLDAYNTDSQVLLRSVGTPIRKIVLYNEQNAAEARLGLEAVPTVWIVRNTRDISPAGITTAMEQEACQGRPRRTNLLEPLADWQRLAMKWAGFSPGLTHFYQLTVCGVRANTPSP